MRTALAFALLGATLAAGCGDDTCGAGDAPTDGITVTVNGTALTYGSFEAGANNDCPAMNAPDGVISLTILGHQVGGTGLLNFCVPRPDELADGARAIGSDVLLTDVTGMTTDCAFVRDDSVDPTGTASAEGACTNGLHPDGFTLSPNATATITLTCGADVTTPSVTVTGTVAVLPTP